jgi:hypothetical protein
MTKKTFKRIVDHIWKHKQKFTKWSRTNEWIYEFDFDDYGGLPETISDHLSSEAVDAMQNIWGFVINSTQFGQPLATEGLDPYTSKREFSKMYRAELTELGERIK